MKIAVAAESDAGEPQAAARPATISKMVALGADVAVEPGARRNRAASAAAAVCRASVPELNLS
jgi:NAD/NADP transhydrogenase alpha subunit